MPKTDHSSAGSNSRPRPLAPTCNVTLIRDDLTTILCEVTSSIRTRSLSDENCDSNLLSATGQLCSGEKVPNASVNSKDKNNNFIAGSDNTVQGGAGTGDLKELLLCLRPIRDGDETIGEDFRFVKTKSTGLLSKKTKEKDDISATKFMTDDKDVATMINKNAGVTKDALEHSATEATLFDIKAKINKMKQHKSRPVKKRPLSSTSAELLGGEHGNKKIRTSKLNAGGVMVIDTEKSVAESLMLMSSHRK